MSLPPPYSDLRPSGLIWAPLIPNHWGVKRAKFLFNLERRPVRPEDDVVTAFRDGEVTLRSKRRTDGFTNSEKEIGYQGVRTGDLVIHAMDAFAGAVGVSDSDGKCSPVYSCCTAIGAVSTEFYGRMLRTMALTGFIESLSKGIRERSTDFRWRELAEQPLPVPPLHEQKLISSYIDRETRRIDALIGKKRKFVALLQEKRQATIVHAVSKGIDPDVPTRSSGLDWLGEIPSHWGIVPATALFKESKERARAGDPMLSATQKYGVIPLAEFEALEQRQVTMAMANLDMRKHVELGDFVISMRSMDGGLERARAVGSVRSSYSVLKPGSEVEGRFYGALMKSPMYIQALRQTSNFIRDGQDLNFGHVRKVRLPKLDIQEQIAIADHIEAEKMRIDRLIELTDRSIELLKEHRSALITAAVTGKIDVRGLAAKNMKAAA